MRRAALLLALLSLIACDDNLPVASFIDKIRVLAVQAEPAEVTPGNATTLSALVVEPDRPQIATSPVSYLWLACAEQPGATFATPCGLLDGKVLGDHDGSAPAACGATIDGTLCTLGKSTTTTLAPAASLVAIGAVLVTLVVADADDGAEGCLLATARNKGLPTEPDRCVFAVKRVTVGGGTQPPNHNPAIDRLDLVDRDGAVRSLLENGVNVSPSLDANNLDVRDLRVQRSEASAEQHTDGTYEALSLSWFTTGGRFQGARSTFDPPGCDSQAACASSPPITTAVTQWQAPDATKAALQTAPDGLMHLWVVLRDDRGGVGWRAGALRVHP